ncbi:MAG: tail fiber domain-containing protein [Bacteroidetes bacterium]|nr:tail fiber domain-containing protein [Bacteroidota bacterium]
MLSLRRQILGKQLFYKVLVFFGIGSGYSPYFRLDVDAGDINLNSFTSAFRIGDGSTGNSFPVLWHNGQIKSIFVGVGAGNSTSTATSNTLIGYQTGQPLTTGDSNLVIGSGAGSSMITASKNVFMGYQAGYSTLSSNNHWDGSATESPGNVAVGFQALYNNTEQVTSTAVGYKALYSYNRTLAANPDEEPATNTACGFLALYSTQAYGGCAFGYEAGRDNVEGCSLIAIGEEAARSNTQGNDNIAIGEAALHSNTQLSGNTAVGVSALDVQSYAPGVQCLPDPNGRPTYGCVFSYNVAVGIDALRSTNPTAVNGFIPTNGAFNTALGSLAGLTNLQGDSLTLLGYAADVYSTSTSLRNSSAIGAGAIVRHNNTMILGNNLINVGIGLSSNSIAPRYKLEISSGINGRSGFGFRNLTSGSAIGISSYGKVLTVDGNGEVMLTDQGSGYGACSNPTVLSNNLGMKLQHNNIYYDGQGYNTAGVMIDAIGLGYSCGASLPGKLSVDETNPSNVRDASIAGAFHNGDNSAGVGSSTTKTGVYVNVDGVLNGIDYGLLNLAGDFIADNCTDVNSAVRGVAGANTGNSKVDIGGDFTGTNGENFSYGVAATANGNGISNSTFGVYAKGVKGNKDNIGVYAYSDGYGSGSNYGIYASAPIGTCTSGGCSDAAGYFNGDVFGINAYIASDRNLKDNIRSIQNSMSIISQLQPKSYVFKTAQFPSLSLPSGDQDGLIAQDVEQVLPGLVKEFSQPVSDSLGNPDPNGIPVNFKAVNYIALIPYLIGGMKEQQQKIDSLTLVLTSLVSRVDNCCSTSMSRSSENNGNNTKSNIAVTLSNNDQIILNQNDPNPFAEHTLITFHIPENVKSAIIVFTDNTGRILRKVPIEHTGDGQLDVFSSTLSNGVYSYTLIADETVIDSKKMVVSK